MGERDELDHPEDEVAKRLNFTTPGTESGSRHRHPNSSPRQAAKVREPLHGYRTGKRRQGKGRGEKFRISVLAGLVVWLLCIAVLVVMVLLNCDRCSELGVKGA